MHFYRLRPAIKNFLNIIGCDLSFSLKDNFCTLNRNNFTCLFIYEIFYPCFQNTRSQFTTDVFFQICFGHFNLFRKAKDLKNVFILFEANCTQQSRNRKFLLTINVGIHHVVNIRCELNPRTFERNDTRAI